MSNFSIGRTLRRFFKSTLLIGTALAILFTGCDLSRDGKVENSISFNRIADSLMRYDSVRIELKTLDGRTVDVVYHTKVENAGDLDRLPAPHWDGGKILVSITGFDDGRVVFQSETRFDGRSDTRESTVIFATPDVGLTSPLRELILLVGDSIALPPVTVSPQNLRDRNLDWKVASPDILILGPGFLKAAREGNTQLSAYLRSNPAVSYSYTVKILASGVAPQTVAVSPDSVELAIGAAKTLFAQVSPNGAPSEVDWSSEAPLIASVDSNGRVSGLVQGETRILAKSKVRPSVLGSARLRVVVPKDLERLAFARDSVVLTAGDPDMPLEVKVQPSGADASARFTLSDSNLAELVNDKLRPIAPGSLQIVLVATAKPEIKDTMYVKILAPTPGDTLPPVKPSVNVAPTGPTRERRPTWTWSSGGGGMGRFQTRLDNPDFSAISSAISETSFRPAADLDPGIHVLYVRELDSAGNWSQPGSASVEIDTAGPAAPKVFGASPTSSLPRWTWSSGGGGGAGFFRLRLGDANFPAGAPESRDTAYSIGSAVDGTTYTLFIQERDGAGNWSAPGSLAIKYDLTKPTVTIVSPRASGTYITAADTLRISGTCTGPNTLAKLEYSLDGGVASAIPLGAAGDWTIPQLKLPNAKTTVIKVMVTDILDNKGEAEISALRDSDPPNPPISLSNPASPTNASLASWTWAPGSDGPSGSGPSGLYRWKLNTGAWMETNTPSALSVALTEGSNIFAVEEQDKAGNWSSSAMDTLVLDTRVPEAVTFTGANNGFTSNRQPTWAWTPSTVNGGISSYEATLEGPDGPKDTTLSAASFRPATALADGAYKLTIRQRDQVPGVWGAASSFTINIDATSPAITVTGRANGSTISLNYANTGTLAGSVTDEGSGLASVTWELSGGTTKASAALASPGSFSLSVPAMANHATTAVTLKATDKAGNVSTYTVKYAIDVAAPTVEWLPGTEDDGFITSGDQVSVNYSINGGAAVSEIINLSEPNQPDTYTTNPKTITASNSIGETVSSTRTYYRVFKDVRFFTPNGKSSYDCKSWKYACPFDVDGTAGKENLILWLSEGIYPITSSFLIPEGSTVKGKLKLTSRTSSEFSNIATTLSSTGAKLWLINVRLEYLNFTFADSLGTRNFLDPGNYQTFPGNPWVIIDHCVFDNIKGGSAVQGAAIFASNNNLSITINETTFNDIVSPNGVGIYIYGFENTLKFTKCRFTGIRPATDIFLGSGRLTLEDCLPVKPNTLPDLTCSGNVCSSE